MIHLPLQILQLTNDLGRQPLAYLLFRPRDLAGRILLLKHEVGKLAFPLPVRKAFLHPGEYSGRVHGVPSIVHWCAVLPAAASLLWNITSAMRAREASANRAMGLSSRMM